MINILKFKGIETAYQSVIYEVPVGKRAKVKLTPSIMGVGPNALAAFNGVGMATSFYLRSKYIIIGNFTIFGGPDMNVQKCIFYTESGGLGFLEKTSSTYSFPQNSRLIKSDGTIDPDYFMVNLPAEHILSEGENVRVSGSGSIAYDFMVIEEDV